MPAPEPARRAAAPVRRLLASRRARVVRAAVAALPEGLRHRAAAALQPAQPEEGPQAGSGPPARPVVRGGVVEVFSRTCIEGWVDVPRGQPPVPVTLRVNRADVVTTWPADPARARRGGRGRELRRFRFVVRDLWDYVGPGDRIRVVVEGQPLPIAGRGMLVRPGRQGRHTPADLVEALSAGHVFSRDGELQLSRDLDTEWQRLVLLQADRVRRFVSDRFGYDAFLVYGTLLGAVREGGFIGHDSDLDLAYVSRHVAGAEVARELQAIAFALIEAGFQVRSFYTHLRISSTIEGHEDVHVDLFHTWFDEGGVLRFPYGVAGVGDLSEAQWRGVREIDFAGGRALLPVAAEEVAEVLYGTGWRQPQPGFSWDRDRTARGEAAMLTRPMVEAVYWADFYTRAEFTTGSTFCEYVGAQADLPQTIVDLGCGDGRDAIAFASAGRRVVGIDRSEVALRHARTRAERLGLSERVTFVALDVAEPEPLRAALDQARESAGGGAVLVYLRFFLHSIQAEVQQALLDTVAAAGRSGDVLAAEFRTTQDARAHKVHGAHYRRYQDGPAFGAMLGERYGYEVLAEREGTGLSPYGDEDPHLYRVIARRR